MFSLGYAPICRNECEVNINRTLVLKCEVDMMGNFESIKLNWAQYRSSVNSCNDKRSISRIDCY